MATHIAWDTGSPNGDYTAYCVWETPSPLRRFLRRIKLDRSTWEMRLLHTEIIE